MATVYAAIQQSVQRPVALKVMSPVLLVDQTFSERFIREARIAANLHHPNIVSIHDVGVHQDHHYTAMELLEGGDLADRLEQPLDIRTALMIMMELCQALDYAHSKGFIHRDVKPENILFREDGSAILTDFGIARALNSSTQMTKTGAIIGTPQYMSPEQARGREIDGRSDLYALGIVFYEMLTGDAPYKGADSITVGIKHITEPVPVLPDDLIYAQGILNLFLAKNPDERYQCGMDAYKDLKILQKRMNLDSGVFVAAGHEHAAEAAQQPVQHERVNSPVDLPETVAMESPTEIRSPEAQEPVIGNMSDLDAVTSKSRPSRHASRAVNQHTREKKGWIGKFVLIILVAAMAAGIWQKDRLMTWPPLAGLLQSMGIGDENSRQSTQQDTVVVTQVDRPANGSDTSANDSTNGADSTVSDADRPSGGSTDDNSATGQDDTQYSGKIQELLNEALTLESQGNQVLPVNDNALVKYQTILELEPDHPAASAAIARIQTSLLNQLERALAANDDAQASELVSQLSLMMPESELTEIRRQLVQAERRRKEADIERQKQAMITDLLARADRAISNNRLSQPEDDNAILYLNQIDDVDPGNAEVTTRKKQVAQKFRTAAASLLESDELETAETQLNIAAGLDPGSAQLSRLRERLKLYQQQRLRNTVTAAQREQISTLLQRAAAAMENGNLMSPPGDSVYDHLKAILRIDPNQAEARSRLTDLARRLLSNSRNSLASQQYRQALEQFRAAEQSDSSISQLSIVRGELSLGLVSWIEGLIDAGQLANAETMLGELSDLDPGLADINRLQLRLNLAREG